MRAIVAMVRLAGVCNCCGQCCSFIHEGRRVFCENLVRSKELGMPEATYCAVWESKYDMMPIRMLGESGDPVVNTVCAVGSEAETRAILTRGVGSGCSYEVKISL